jgi:hypothetical protein
MQIDPIQTEICPRPSDHRNVSKEKDNKWDYTYIAYSLFIKSNLRFKTSAELLRRKIF